MTAEEYFQKGWRIL